MGFFQDLRTLSKQGRALSEQYPVQQRLAYASAQLSAATSMLEQSTKQQAAGQRLLTDGVDAVAVVTAARQTNALMNHNPMVEIDLLVTMPSGAHIPVRRTEVVPLLHLARVQVGSRLLVRVDPADANALWINWSAPAQPG
jgi:hypothetical protein